MSKEKTKANWSQLSTTAENEKLPGWFKWVWSGPTVAYGLNFLLMAQISYYCTDILGMGATITGMLLVFSKVFDAFTDIMAGYIVDHTKTRWGKARPYDIFVPLSWICTVLLFSTPDFGMTGKCIYVFCLYTVTNAVCNTFQSCGSNIYIKQAIRSEKNWTSVTAFQGAMTLIFSLGVGIALPTLIATLGTTRSGWTLIALLHAVPLCIIGSIRMFTIREMAAESNQVKEEEKAPTVTLKETLRALSKNILIMILGVMVLLYQVSITANGQTYYLKWIFGDIGLGSIIALSCLVTPIVLIFVPGVMKKIGKEDFLIAGMIINLLGTLLRLIAPTNIVVLLIASVLTLIGSLPLSSMLTVYVLDCMDYAKKRSGISIDGVTSSVSGFAMKVGSSLGSGVLGIFLGMAGYISDSAATSQPASALGMISFLYVGLPIVLGVILLVAALLYKKVKSRVE